MRICRVCERDIKPGMTYYEQGVCSEPCYKSQFVPGEKGNSCEINKPSVGLRYDEDKERVDLIPADVLLALGKHFGIGSKKYFDDNWRIGLGYKSTYGCLMRHLLKWWDGEDLDAETGSHHLIAVIWNAVALMYYELHPDRYSGFDDRYYTHNTHNPGTDEEPATSEPTDAELEAQWLVVPYERDDIRVLCRLCGLYIKAGSISCRKCGNIVPQPIASDWIARHGFKSDSIKDPSDDLLFKIKPTETLKWDGTERRSDMYQITLTYEELSKLQKRLEEATGTSIKITDIIRGVKSQTKEKNNETRS